MTKNTLKPLLWLTAFVLMVGLACSAASAPAPTPTLEPTNPPPPTNTAAPPPTKAPTAVNTPPDLSPSSVYTRVLVCVDCAMENIPINIWQFPGTTRGEVVMQALHNSIVNVKNKKIADDNRTWYLIEYSGVDGWVAEDFISIQKIPVVEKAFELDNVLFEHPDGLFELYPPTGWTAEPDTGSVSFSDPTNVGFMYLQVTNTGTELDMTAFERFADAREANFFAKYDGYTQTEREVYPDTAVISIVKEFDLDGVSQTVLTVYDKKGSVVYAIDFWADTADFDRYLEGYLEVFDTINVDSSAAAKEPVYYWIFTFTGPNGLFQIEVPSSWRYERSESDTVIVDTFYSPDEHAVIQNITYDDGKAISKSLAGQFALELLRTYYATDIRITGDKVQPDGSERLTWNSPSGNYSGVSFLETRGTTFLMFTVMYDNPYEKTYLEMLDYVISTYTVP